MASNTGQAGVTCARESLEAVMDFIRVSLAERAAPAALLRHTSTRTAAHLLRLLAVDSTQVP
eukprot:scaffold7625_cov277-Pinguiococcus_pyrenoidosus.AAC.1